MPRYVAWMLAAVATRILSLTPASTFPLKALLQEVQFSQHLLQLIKDELH